MRSQTERLYFISERLFVVGALVYFMGAIIPVLKNPGHVFAEAQASDPLALLLQSAIYAGALIFMIPIRGSVLNACAKNPLLCSLLFLVLVSCIWSPASLFTLRKAIVLLATTGFGLYLGTRFEIREQIRLVALALAVCAVLSVVFIVALPRYGVDMAIYHGAWRGVFFHKNTFGTYMVVAMITFLCFRAESVGQLVAKYFGLVLSVVLVIGSQAKGSYVVMAAMIVLSFLYRLLHIYWKRLIPAATVALTLVGIAAVYVASNLDSFLALLGKDATFSGRIPLWTAILSLSSGNRLLGFGYGGFWATNTYTVWSMVAWNSSKAHNGYIDLLVDLGWIGVAIFALNTGLALWRSMKLVARDKTLESQWPLLILSLILLYNIIESDLLVMNSFMWVAYVAITVSLQRAWSFSRATERTINPEAAGFSTSEFEPCPQ
jgi:exopolysaccharide production protein ExoQ